jgi:glutathione synthase/RimK-type ligase-like ATP-grasp enzyme
MNHSLKKTITSLRYSRIGKLVPKPLKNWGYSVFGGHALDQRNWQREYDRVLVEARRMPIKHPDVKLGIVKDKMLRHSYYEAACLELGVPYEVIDITGDDWIEQVRATDFDAYVVRPFVLDAAGKHLYDDRVRMLTEDLGKLVYPSPKSLWLYESKSRVAHWLEAHDVAAPKTWVFSDRQNALDFVATAEFPIVFKTDVGSEALGVEIVRDCQRAQRLIKKCFGRGYIPKRGGPQDRQLGLVLFQEFIPNAREWRVVRIENSYFGHRKGRKGDFHSGSKVIEFDTPPRELLEFVRDVTDRGNFSNMALDILEDETGTYRVIELHTYFGCNSPHVMAVNGVPGRYVHDPSQGIWRFEPGDEFNRNASCNLRIKDLLLKLKIRACV